MYAHYAYMIHVFYLYIICICGLKICYVKQVQCVWICIANEKTVSAKVILLCYEAARIILLPGTLLRTVFKFTKLRARGFFSFILSSLPASIMIQNFGKWSEKKKYEDNKLYEIASSSSSFVDTVIVFTRPRTIVPG